MMDKEYKGTEISCYLMCGHKVYETPLKNPSGEIVDTIHFCPNCGNAHFVKKDQNFDALIFKRLSGYIKEIQEVKLRSSSQD